MLDGSIGIVTEHHSGAEVVVPPAAMKFAEKAVAAGWTAYLTTARGPLYDKEGQPVMVTRSEANDVEQGGGNVRVKTDVERVVETVAVRCRRGRDYLYALWADGKFDYACRPKALRILGSREAVEHLQRPLDAHRWLPSNHEGMDVCEYHGETRVRD